MRMERDPHDKNLTTGECDRCQRTNYRYRGDPNDIICQCGAIYNIFGQRLRDDLYSRPINDWDDEQYGDMEADERSWLRQEAAELGTEAW